MVDPYEVRNTGMDDLKEIFDFFDQSISYQEKHGYPAWINYDKNAIIRDIENKHQYKVVIGSRIGIVFSVGYTDQVIWRTLDKGNSIYLHRIVVNPELKGRKLFGLVLNWAVQHAEQKGLGSIRMDTWADNPSIIRYYQNFGFAVIENYTTPDSAALPVHNRNLALTLMEYRPPKDSSKGKA